MSSDGLRVISQHGMPDYCLVYWRLTEAGWVVSWVRSIADVAVESLTLAPDSCLMAMIVRSAIGERWEANPRQVEVWDSATGKIIGKADYPYAYAPTLQFAPNGRQLVGINDMTVMVWAVPRLNAVRLVRNDNRKDFTSVAYHPSGLRIYAGNNDGTIQVFDTATWECLDRFTWQIGRPKSVVVSADGTLAAAGGDNGDIVIWDVD